MKRLDPSLACPSCRGPLVPRVLVCEPCDLKVEGSFRASEFGSLDAELMHFLRIFVHCEGRIKDMEKALGVSYPTVKATMTRLKSALGMTEVAPPAPAAEDPIAVLQAMEQGEINYKEGLNRLKTLRKKPT